MTALELVTVLSQSLYVVVFALVALRYASARTPAHLDMVLFFGILAFVVIEQRVVAALDLTIPEWSADVIVILVVALPYVLLRLVDDFTTVRPLLKRACEALLLGFSIAILMVPQPIPTALVLALVVYISGLFFYCAARLVTAARTARGVTQRRLQAIGLGMVLFGLQTVVSGVSGQLPEPERPLLAGTGQILGLLAALAFFLGFAPPAFLRRAWQAGELRLFLTRAAQLPRLPTTLAIVRELERGAAASTGADAHLGVWEPDEQVIRFWGERDEPQNVRPGTHISGRVFELQRAMLSVEPARDDPQAADDYRANRVGAILAAPITTGERRLGVLLLTAERPPIFAVGDIELAQLLADQAAVILESRALIDHAARVRASEEATRLKEDFVSAAAHDLKTPLTTVVAQAQFLERKALRDPSAPADLQGLQRIVREGQRLATLVTDLLDVARLERGRLLAEREPVDLGAMVTQVVARQPAGVHQCDVEVRGAIVGTYDRRRIEQLVENLVENAKKYSPEATPVRLAVWQEDGEARITVRDQGIGIPASDLPRIFERFSRASNVDDRRFHGMGLGLYICRGIVEEHGGRIWVESDLGKGTTFHVALPAGEGRRLN